MAILGTSGADLIGCYTKNLTGYSANNQKYAGIENPRLPNSNEDFHSLL